MMISLRCFEKGNYPSQVEKKGDVKRTRFFTNDKEAILYFPLQKKKKKRRGGGIFMCINKTVKTAMTIYIFRLLLLNIN